MTVARARSSTLTLGDHFPPIMSSWTSLETSVYIAALILVSVGTVSIVGVTVYCLCWVNRIPKRVTSERRTDAKEIHEHSSAASAESERFPEEDMSYDDLWSYAMVRRNKRPNIGSPATCFPLTSLAQPLSKIVEFNRRKMGVFYGRKEPEESCLFTTATPRELLRKCFIELHGTNYTYHA